MESNSSPLESLAYSLLQGSVSVEQFVARLQRQGIADVGTAQVDLDRERRCGFPEVVYAPGKTVEAIIAIFQAQLARGIEVFATRIAPEQAEAVLPAFPNSDFQTHYNKIGRTLRIGPAKTKNAANGSPAAPTGRVTLVTAGTSDLPVAEEARETLLWTGAEVTMVQDVGVAGPQRLQANLHLLDGADAVVVVAGMEGALPSVVGGYVACPVIAVPTSVGYGASFGGLAPLLGMLNSCASNVTVVNIDAGFKGGYVAGLIAKNAAGARNVR
jgi:NCAIR mutase (PurE)-related protein